MSSFKATNNVCHSEHLHYVTPAPVSWHVSTYPNFCLNDSQLNCSPWLAILKTSIKSCLTTTCLSGCFWCNVMSPHHTLSSLNDLSSKRPVCTALIIIIFYQQPLPMAISAQPRCFLKLVNERCCHFYHALFFEFFFNHALKDVFHPQWDFLSFFFFCFFCKHSQVLSNL